MDLTFEFGDPEHPKGHALVYFRVSTEPDKVYATYVITLPIKADLGKYVPPFLASHLGGMPLSDFSAFAMPPVPEPVDGLHELERLSREREDDLVYASDMFSFDLPRMMEAITEAVQAYSDLCSQGSMNVDVQSRSETIEAIPTAQISEAREEEDSSLQVNDVLFGFMSEGDKLAELSRFMGKLRFALEGQDSDTAEEATQEIATLAKHLPDHFQVGSLLTVAKDTSPKSSKLAQLYLDRCFRLSAGDVAGAKNLEAEIEVLKLQA